MSAAENPNIQGQPLGTDFAIGSIRGGIEDKSAHGRGRKGMAMGPLEYVVIEFPGNQFRGEILPALKELVSKGTVRIVDLLVIKKDADGTVEWFEGDQLVGPEARFWSELEGEVDDLVNADDVQLVAEGLAPNSAAGLLVWENVWAERFADAVRNAQGRVIAQERIPYAVIQPAVDAAHPAITSH